VIAVGYPAPCTLGLCPYDRFCSHAAVGAADFLGRVGGRPAHWDIDELLEHFTLAEAIQPT
jgi:hypothetical protein